MIIEVLAFKFNFFTFTKVPFNKGYLVLVAMIMALFIVGCSRSSRHEVQPTISIVPTAEIPLSLLLPEKGSVTVHFGFDSRIADKITNNPEYSSILNKLRDPQTGKVPEILLKELMNFSVTSDNSNGQALGDAFRDMLTKGAIQKVSTQDLVIDIDHDPKLEGKGSLHIRKITPGETLLILSKYNLGNTSDYSVVMTGDIKMNGANGSIFLSSCQLSDITAPCCSGNRESSTSISSAEWSKVQAQASSHLEDKSTVLCLGVLLDGVGEAWIDNIVLSGRVSLLTPKPSAATESHEGTQTSKMPITIRFKEASFKPDQISSVSLPDVLYGCQTITPTQSFLLVAQYIVNTGTTNESKPNLYTIGLGPIAMTDKEGRIDCAFLSTASSIVFDQERITGSGTVECMICSTDILN